MPRITRTVERLHAAVPFVGPEAAERERGEGFRARIGANENVFGPSPKAKEAMRKAAEGVWMYGDPENHDLKCAIAEHLGVGFENVVVGEGIDGLLGYLVRMTVEPGVRVVTSSGAYPTFNFHVNGYGGELVMVPYRDDHEDPDGLIGAAEESGAALVYLANPDNPMGTWHPAATVGNMVGRIPEGSLLVLDEAYVECMPAGNELPFDTSDPRVIRMRTFSKIHGMAGARVGYAVGHRDLIAAFDKIRNHFGMCRISQAGALAALTDREHLDATVRRIGDARRRIAEIAVSCGLKPIPSGANFVAVDCGGDGALAVRVMEALIRRGVFVRKPFVSPQDRCIRISAGTDRDLDLLSEVLPVALEAART